MTFKKRVLLVMIMKKLIRKRKRMVMKKIVNRSNGTPPLSITHLFTRPPTLRDKICCSVTNNIKVKDSSSLCASMSQNNVSWLRTIGNVYSLVLIWQYETRATSTNWKIVVLSIYWKWETWKFYLFSKLSHNLPTLRLFVLLHTWQLTNKKKRCKKCYFTSF